MVVPAVQVFEALTKRTRSDTVAIQTKLTRVKDSALARRIWVDKVRWLYGLHYCTAKYVGP